jgi:amino acid transporter
MTASEAVQERPSNSLVRNALGLPSALAMSMAFISPTIGVIFISALIASKAGIASPFTFILGTLGIALMASTLAQFTRRVTSAGTFYKFVCLSLGRQAGFVVGILLMFAYALQSPLNTNLFGGFVSNALQTDFGITIPWWVLMIAIVGILLFLIVFRGGDGGQVPQAFNPAASSQGFGGLGQAFVFIVLAFFGFESSSTVAEEVRNPRKNLPIALVGSVLLTGAWFTFAMYSIVVGYGAKHIDKLAAASAPLHDLAVRYIGPWYGYLIDLAAISALIAVLLAIHTANFRIFYSLGRDGLLPTPLGRTHPKHGTPHIAIIAYSVVTLVIGLIAGIAWGPLNAFGDLGYLSSLGILPIFIATNVALPVFILKRHRSEFSVLVHVVMPTLSTLTFFAALYLNLVPLPAAPLSVMPLVIIAIIVGAAIWGAVLARRGSRVLERIGEVLFLEAEARPEPQDLEGSAASIASVND